MTRSPFTGDAYIVALQGDLDIFRAPEVRRALSAAADKPRLIIDMTRTESISAAILSEFVRCYKQRLARGFEAARLVVRSAHLRKIFEITELAKLWNFFESIEAAAAA